MTYVMEKGRLVRDDKFLYLADGTPVPLRQVHIIRTNWKRGLVWFICSPMYALRREQIAEIVATKL